MQAAVTLKQAERKVFRASFGDGLWDILIGFFVMEFSLAPLFSESLGDFWSSFIFLPIWGLVYLAIRLIRRNVVRPRLGYVKYGPATRARLFRFNIISFITLSVALILGILSAVNFESLPGWVHVARFALIVLIIFGVAAYFLDFSRLYIYGIMAALSLPVGEYLYRHYGFAHHGYPVVFGITSGSIILTGLIIFIRFLRHNPLPADETNS